MSICNDCMTPLMPAEVDYKMERCSSCENRARAEESHLLHQAGCAVIEQLRGPFGRVMP